MMPSGRRTVYSPQAVARALLESPLGRHRQLLTALKATLSYTGWNCSDPTFTIGDNLPPQQCSEQCSEQPGTEELPRWTAATGLDDAVYVAPKLLDQTTCEAMVCLVETQLAGNWTTSRHYSVPATDVPVWQIPALSRWFNRQLAAVIFPMMGAQFGEHMIDGPHTHTGGLLLLWRRLLCTALRCAIMRCNALCRVMRTTGVDGRTLRVIDAFVVRYSAEKQRSLPLHR
jgi:hypothetical protein